MKNLTAILLVSAILVPTQAFARETDDQVRERLIRQSLAVYPGNCPCPYNTDRAGRRCGGRSAYSRPGGRAPLCYPEDVSQDQVQRNRR